jgi:quercetin dioxygenase-like cupin family protein
MSSIQLHTCDTESKAKVGYRTELTANSFSGGMSADFEAKDLQHLRSFSSKRLLATPRFLIPLARAASLRNRPSTENLFDVTQRAAWIRGIAFQWEIRLPRFELVPQEIRTVLAAKFLFDVKRTRIRMGKFGDFQMTSKHGRQALRPAAGGMVTIRIADEIARLKDATEWTSGDRHAVSLVKDDALNVLLMMLKKGSHLHEHRTKGPITVQVVSGSVRFSGGSEQRIIAAGEIVALDRGIPHSLEALDESALILTTVIG